MSTDIAPKEEWIFSDDAAYCYVCSNEKTEGVQFKEFPDAPAPLVIDMSSDFLSRPIKNWLNIGCSFAAAQKNFGIAGMSVVIVRFDLLARKVKLFWSLTLDYRIQVKCVSMYNTPPVFPIYVANVVFQWIEEQSGVGEIEKINEGKAKKIDAAIEASRWFENVIAQAVRSDMNIPFFRAGTDGMRDDVTDGTFPEVCEKRWLVNLKGSGTVGGYRASIYNAIPMEGVDTLAKAIRDFPGFSAEFEGIAIGG
jgi:phosphoserine aminotransferase